MALQGQIADQPPTRSATPVILESMRQRLIEDPVIAPGYHSKYGRWHARSNCRSTTNSICYTRYLGEHAAEAHRGSCHHPRLILQIRALACKAKLQINHHFDLLNQISWRACSRGSSRIPPSPRPTLQIRPLAWKAKLQINYQFDLLHQISWRACGRDTSRIRSSPPADTPNTAGGMQSQIADRPPI